MRHIYVSIVVALLFLFGVSSTAMAASMEVFLTRSDDYLNPSASFAAEMDLDLSDVSGVTGVTVSFGSSVYPLKDGGGGQWWNDTDITFATLAAMKTALGGTWTIAVAGSNPSSSTFTLTTSGLADGDFFATATGLSPVNGATNVPADTALSWTDPTGSSTPWALDVFVEGNTGSEQEALSLDDPVGFPVTSTNWQPPSPLANDSYEFAVTYVNHDEALASPLVETPPGSITWSASPFAPSGYPATDPLVLKGSEAIVEFTVPEPAASTSAAAAIGTLLLLARLRRRSRCLA